MDKKSKIFFTIFGLLIVISVALTYWRIMIKKDYIIEAQADCDPMLERCFVWTCDPASGEEWEMCTGVPEDDIFYYKLIKRNASRIPLCDPADENCQALVCDEDEPECEYTFCTEENKEEQGVECNDPVVYAAENPVVEAENACIEGEICPLDEVVDTTMTDEFICVEGETCAVSNPEMIEATTSTEEASTSVEIN